MRKLKSKILYLGLSYKKEILTLLICELTFLIFGVVSFVILKQPIYLLIGLGLDLIFYLTFLTRYNSKIQTLDELNLREFSTLFSYFKIYLKNGYSVYGALKEIRLFANPSLGSLLDTLIEEIDEDKTVQPFVKFARHFNEIIIEEMMISIYQMIDDGEQSEYLTQFELIFDKFSDSIYQKNLRAKDSKLGTLSSAPLICSCFLIIILTLGIIGILGELINGI